jgi:hypothetical protein
LLLVGGLVVSYWLLAFGFSLSAKAGSFLCVALRQGTTSVVPKRRQKKNGFSRCKTLAGAKARSFPGTWTARLKWCPDTRQHRYSAALKLRLSENSG